MHIMKKYLFAISISVAATALALPSGGRAKKHVGLLFDVMGTTPSNILANAEKFAEHTPYLDGVAICLNNVVVKDGESNVITSELSRIMSGTERWTRDAVKKYIPTLREISKKPHLTESFLLFWMSPKYCDTRLHWADDKAWANYAENMAVAAWVAKEGCMKGLMLDPEEYASASQYVHTSDDPPYEECAKLARRRGREVFSRVFKEYPDIVLFTLWYFAVYRGYPDGVNRTDPVGFAEDAGDLAFHFYNGILDVIPTGARIIDGCEHYSLSATRYQYLFNANSILTSLLPFVAPENVNKYRQQVLAGNTLFLDMYTQNANPESRWYHGPVDGSRLEHLRRNFQQSYLTASEYVWIYGEKSAKIFDWSNGHYEKQKTWEDNIPGMTETFMLIKDPERWAAKRREKLSAEGKLVNLVADAKPVKLQNPTREIEYDRRQTKMSRVDNVRPGDRYVVSVTVRASVGRRGKRGRREAACPRVVWLKGGRLADAQPTPIEVPPEVTEKLVRVGGIVTVPEGVDGFIFDLACKLNAGENVEYRYPSICNALDPVKIEFPLTPIELAVGSIDLLERPKAPTMEDFNAAEEKELELEDEKVEAVKAENKGSSSGDEKKVSALKWKLDLERNRLSNGHWKLNAWVSKGRLYAYGFGEKTHGGGVLDLRKVKEDIGQEVYGIGNFCNYQGITAVVAPGVKSVDIRAFTGCSNLTACVVGKADPADTSLSAASERVKFLQYIARFEELADTHIRFTQRHNRVSSCGAGLNIRVTDIEPGALYNFMASMRRNGSGRVYVNGRFSNAKGRLISNVNRTISMKQPRKEGVWRDGELVVRAPKDAIGACFNIYAELYEGDASVEVDKFAIYKIGDPLPVWPKEFELEKGTKRVEK